MRSAEEVINFLPTIEASLIRRPGVWYLGDGSRVKDDREHTFPVIRRVDRDRKLAL